MKLLVGILILTAALQPYVSTQTVEYDDNSATESSNLETSDGGTRSILKVPGPWVECPHCSTDYQPVCGTDGNSYGNLCLLKCVSDAKVESNPQNAIFLLYNFRCPSEPCPCALDFDPVCGSDIITYYNECFLNCENKRLQNLGLQTIHIIRYGKCNKILRPYCPDTSVPICGTDNVTYRNFCYLNFMSNLGLYNGLPPVFFKHAGPCKTESCPCSTIYKPVCASNGQTFDNICLLDCENRLREALGLKPLTVKHQGACCDCQAVWKPVCGSDGKTYRNLCIFNCYNKQRLLDGLPSLYIQYLGVCGCNCKDNYDPVCGTDGKTYGNICLLQCEIKRLQYLGLKLITLAHYGPCICNCSYCNPVYNAVCGSDGKTYWNFCWLNCHSNCNVKNNLPKITLAYFGYC